MMKLSDALAIAATKFKTRKLRNAFAAFTISLGIVIILVFLFAAAGIIDTTKKVFVDSLAGRYFASESFDTSEQIVSVDNGNPVMGNFDGIDQKAALLPESASTDAYQTKKVADGVEGISQVYQNRFLYTGAYGFGMARSDGKEPAKEFSLAGEGLGLSAVDPIFLKDFVFSGYADDRLIDGKVPVFIPMSVTGGNQLSQEQSRVTKTQKQIFEEHKQNAVLFIGQTFTLTLNETNTSFDDAGVQQPKTAPAPTSIQVIVVGFIPDGTMQTQLYGPNSIVLPSWAIAQVPVLQSVFDHPSSISQVSEYNSKAQRDAAVLNSIQQMNGAAFEGHGSDAVQVSTSVAPQYLSEVPGRFDFFSDAVKFLRSAALGVGGFFLVISSFFLMTTLGKIISDSQKEIGVFRAVGAQKRDVKKIYFGYAWLLVTLGCLMGLVIAVGLDIIASIEWGDKVFYEMANFGVSLDVAAPRWLFADVVPAYLLAVYMGMMVLGMLAAALPVRRASRVDPITVLKDM